MGVERNKMNERGRVRLNLPARKIRVQVGWQRALCDECTSIRRVICFYFDSTALRNYRYVLHDSPCWGSNSAVWLRLTSK